MKRSDAFEALGLPAGAPRDEIEAARARLARRYPPEFQPEKFRRLDEAYRFLTSLPFFLGELLAAHASPDDRPASGEIADRFPPVAPPPDAAVDEALSELAALRRLEALWGASPKDDDDVPF